MPVEECREDDKPGFRYGKSGKCYVYTPGDRQAMKVARSKAIKQGKAIEESKEDD